MPIYLFISYYCIFGCRPPLQFQNLFCSNIAGKTLPSSGNRSKLFVFRTPINWPCIVCIPRKLRLFFKDNCYQPTSCFQKTALKTKPLSQHKKLLKEFSQMRQMDEPTMWETELLAADINVVDIIPVRPANAGSSCPCCQFRCLAATRPWLNIEIVQIVMRKVKMRFI